MDIEVNVECLDKAENCKFVFITDQYFWQKIVNISLDKSA